MSVMLWPEKDELYPLKTLIMSLLVFSACVMVWTVKSLKRKRRQAELLVSVAVRERWKGKSPHELL